MRICRRTEIELSFYDSLRRQWLGDFCHWTVGLSGPIDEESGMILNLVDIDLGLKQFTEKFSQSQIKDLEDFFKSSREFLETFYSRRKVRLEFLSLKTSWGRIAAEFPWGSDNFKFSQQRKIRIPSSDRTSQVQKFFIEHQGCPASPLQKLEENKIQSLWKLRDKSTQLEQLMKEMNLASFGYQDFTENYQRLFFRSV